MTDDVAQNSERYLMHTHQGSVENKGFSIS